MRTDVVRFGSKGQVVIPRWLRQELGVESGTRAIVQASPEGIQIVPLTKTRIHRLRGSLKRKPGKELFAEAWARYKAEEKSLEETK